MENIFPDSDMVESSPYNHIYGRIPLPTRGYIPAPRTMYIGEWDWWDSDVFIKLKKKENEERNREMKKERNINLLLNWEEEKWERF